MDLWSTEPLRKTSNTMRSNGRTRLAKGLRLWTLIGLLCLSASVAFIYLGHHTLSYGTTERVPLDAAALINRCRSLRLTPGPPSDFYARNQSDRFQQGTHSVLIRNATIWTGELDGKEVLLGDVFLDRGIIQIVQASTSSHMAEGDSTVIDAQGAWLTPGIIDMHSHLSVESSPGLSGAQDGNSIKGPVVPWLRALDALNTHDEGFLHAISGGVTTSLILPGSLNAIGGQGYVMKMRPTKERSPTSMLLEPPYGLNGSDPDPNVPPRWLHMKHACGENPRNYGDTRMDTVWAVRNAYNTARAIKDAQDDYCAKATSGDWASIRNQKFPESLQWDAMVEILRGRVKVQTHCYEALDIDNFVRISNEFQFSVAAFHHAHEAYLVPDVLKRAYKNVPAVAMFSTFSRYKREAYRHSEFAPRLLAKEGIDVVMKSDHPAIVSRNLVHEAAVAHYYGLPEHIALASVISTPAKVLGLDHRIGFIAEGYDADVVLWDSHPLALGATPTQVFIDGIPQLPNAHVAPKPAEHQRAPSTPDFSHEAAVTLKYDGLPPLTPKRKEGVVVFTNVTKFWQADASQDDVVDVFGGHHPGDPGVVAVERGRVVCAGSHSVCASRLAPADAEVVDLQGGAVQPGLTSYGSSLGLAEIALESSTGDGRVNDPLEPNQSALLGLGGYLAKAADGLQFGTRDAWLAYRSGVTLSVTSPLHDGWLSGLSVAFTPALRIDLLRAPSCATSLHCIAHLGMGTLARARTWGWFQQVANGSIPLVVDVGSADIIASLISLKKEVEQKAGSTMKLTIASASEAHLIADELADAGVGVIVTPPRSYPYTWDEHRILPGPPLSSDSLIGHLLKHNVTVGLGPHGIAAPSHPDAAHMAVWSTRNLRFDAGEAMLDAGSGVLSKSKALALASVNVERLLGLEFDPEDRDLVATIGGDLLDFGGKVAAVISPRQGVVDIFV